MDCINCTDYFCTDYSNIVGIQNFHDSLIASCTKYKYKRLFQTLGPYVMKKYIL